MLEFLSIGSHTSKRCPAKKQKVEVGTFANLPPFSVQSATASVDTGYLGTWRAIGDGAQSTDDDRATEQDVGSCLSTVSRRTR